MVRFRLEDEAMKSRLDTNTKRVDARVNAVPNLRSMSKKSY